MEDFILRKATIKDLNDLCIVEKQSWGSMAASRSEIKKRLLQFPEDFLVLEKEGTKEIKFVLHCKTFYIY